MLLLMIEAQLDDLGDSRFGLVSADRLEQVADMLDRRDADSGDFLERRPGDQAARGSRDPVADRIIIRIEQIPVMSDQRRDSRDDSASRTNVSKNQDV